MLFPSVVFLAVFAPLFLVCYFALPWRNLTFFLFSLGFFYWGENKYIGVLLAFVAINYLFGLLVGRAERPERRRLFLGLGVGANLSLLFYYKYFAFALTQVLPDLFGVSRGRGARAAPAAGHLLLHLPRHLLPDRRLPQGGHLLGLAAQRRPVHHHVPAHGGRTDRPLPHHCQGAGAAVHHRRPHRLRPAPVRHRPGPEDAHCQQPGRSGGSGVRPARRGAGRGGRLDRHRGLHPADLFRLLRLLVHGHRHRRDPRLPPAAQLPLPLLQPVDHRVLAALAYFAVHLVPRLPVHPAGRQPARPGAHPGQPVRGLPALRPVARSGLHLYPLGRVPRTAAHCRAARFCPGAGADRRACCAMSTPWGR